MEAEADQGRRGQFPLVHVSDGKEAKQNRF